jgi:hypothetical protein
VVDPDLPEGPDVSLFDAAEWAVLSTGVLTTDPPLVVEALTFTVPHYLQPWFEYLTTTGTRDANTLAEFVVEASGIEFDSFDAVTIRESEPRAEIAAQVANLLGEFVSAIGIEDDGKLAAELAELRLPVFGSQPQDSKPLKDWVASAGGAGNVLICIATLAGPHAPALLLLTGPVGAAITIGTYATLGGAWTVNRVRKRRARKREADDAKAAADAAQAVADAKTSTDAKTAAEAQTAVETKAAADAEVARQHTTAQERQELLKLHYRARPIRDERPGG